MPGKWYSLSNRSSIENFVSSIYIIHKFVVYLYYRTTVIWCLKCLLLVYKYYATVIGRSRDSIYLTHDTPVL